VKKLLPFGLVLACLLLIRGEAGAAFRKPWRERFYDLVVSWGAKLILRIEGVIARGSLVGDPMIFPADAFPWTGHLSRHWREVRAELQEVLRDPDLIPPFQALSRNQRSLTDDDRWKTYFFYAFGYKAERNCNRCPKTTRLVEQVPGMTTAFFSILAPGKHLPPHRGAFKGLLRYHLALQVPEPRELCLLRVGSQYRSWTEGEAIIFDDTYEHEVWNDTDGTRVVLFMDFKRPLRFPVNVFNSLIIAAIKHSPFVKDAVTNYNAWQQQLDRAADTAPAR
jgi:beta-hydroxylase